MPKLKEMADPLPIPGPASRRASAGGGGPAFPRQALACVAVLGLGAFTDTSRNALPPDSPPFARHAGAMFADDFHDPKLPAWRPDDAHAWTVRRGMLRASLPDERQLHSLIHAGDSTWTDYAVDVDVCGMRGVDKGVVVRVRGTRGLGVDLRGPGYHDVRIQLNEFPVGRADDAGGGNGVWQHVRVEARGSHARVLVDGGVVFDRTVPGRMPASGGIALAAYTGGVGECTVFYDNVVVTKLAGADDP